jgi:hypothetical protein
LFGTTFWANGTTNSRQDNHSNCKCYFGVAPYEPRKGIVVDNRNKVTKKLERAGDGLSWDEFPYASTKEGGNDTVKVARVPASENHTQGGFLGGFYRISFPGKLPNTNTNRYEFLVVPVPNPLY